MRDRARLAAFLRRADVFGSAVCDDERFAIPLSGDDAPPLLIVRGDGLGVTCLAAGMVAAAPRVAWPTVLSWLEEEARLFRARVAAHQWLSPGEEGERGESVLARIVSRPWRVDDKDLRALETLAPLVIESAREGIVRAGDLLESIRQRPLSWTDERARAAWQIYLGAAHWLVACRQERVLLPLAWGILASGRDVMLVARAMWLLTIDPERTFETLPALANARDLVTGLACRYVLPGIALRHPARARDAARLARELLAAQPVADADLVCEAIRSFDAGPAAASALLQGCLASGFLASLRDDELQAWAPLAEVGTAPRLETLRRGDSARAASADHAASVAVWRALLQRLDRPWLRPDDPYGALLPALLPLEALLPGELPDLAHRPREGQRYVRERLVALVRSSALERPRPARAGASPEVGRNQPCPCGSGRKFKACHGGRR